MIFVLTLAALWLALGVTTAHAFPLIAVVVAAAGITGLAATIATSIIGIAAGFGISYVASLIFKPEVPKTPPGGAKLDLRVDAKVPRSFIFGEAVVVGSLVYGNTHGASQWIDNNKLIEIIALSDYPVTELVDTFVEGKHAALVSTGGAFQLDDYRNPDSGEALVNFKFYDGSQTSADAETLAAFATADRPWTSTEIGKYVAYVRTHYAYNPAKITGPLQFKHVVKGLKLYDPRKDSSVGGSGAHRWNTATAGTASTTYEYSDNFAVLAYNILRGIYLEGAFFYGLEGTTASQFPLDNWFAAMNACDETFSSAASPSVSLAKYAGGGEITVDTEPMDVIKEIVKSCGGRFVEYGGIYKFYIDPPSVPDFSFTDDDLVANKDGTFKPVLPLESRINYVTGSCISSKSWSPIDLTPVGDADRELADGRRLPAELTLAMVSNIPRAQRLMRQILNRAKRERRHNETLMPRFAGIEPGFIGAWTSTRNGYTAKLFVVESVQIEGNLAPVVTLLEVDPTDYDWSSSFEPPDTDGTIDTVLPDPKVIGGFTAEAVTREGDKHTKKPGIKVSWDDPVDGDVVRVELQWRKSGDTANVAKAAVDAADLAAIIEGGLAPETAYEVRGRFGSKEGWDADWSLWIPVTTVPAYVGLADFDDAVKHQIIDEVNAAKTRIEQVNTAISTTLLQLQSDVTLNKQQITQQLQSTAHSLQATFDSEIDTATGPGSAIAAQLSSLSATVGKINTGLSTQMVVGVTPAGAIAAYELTATAQKAKAGFRLVAFDNGNGTAYGQIWMDADNFYVGKSGSATFKPVFIIDTVKKKVLINGDLVVTSLLAARAKIGKLSAIAADLGQVSAGTMTFRQGNASLVIDSKSQSIVVDDGT